MPSYDSNASLLRIMPNMYLLLCIKVRSDCHLIFLLLIATTLQGDKNPPLVNTILSPILQNIFIYVQVSGMESYTVSFKYDFTYQAKYFT
jgi:hypothetical protein